MKKEFHVHLADGSTHVKDMNPIFDLMRKNPKINLGFNIKPTDPIVTELAMSLGMQGFFISERHEPIQRYIAPSQIKSIDVVFETEMAITKK